MLYLLQTTYILHFGWEELINLLMENGDGLMVAIGPMSTGLFDQVIPAMVQLEIVSLSRIMHGFMMPAKENTPPSVRYQPN